MHPIILTKQMKVLVIGGGKAALTKLKRLIECYSDITCISTQFLQEIQNSKAKCINDNFYELGIDYYRDFDLIYLSIPYPDTNANEAIFKTKVANILSLNKLLSVSSKPELGNFITPASRTNDNITISVTTSGKSPKQAVKLAEQMIEIVKNKDISQ